MRLEINLLQNFPALIGVKLDNVALCPRQHMTPELKHCRNVGFDLTMSKELIT